MNSVGVFLGGSNAAAPVYVDAARQLGETLARRGLSVVYGGGHIGLMGVLANAALLHGGKVIGVMPQHLIGRELAHTGLTELHIVEDMAQRKAKMAELSDVFLALPGGFGTLDEVFEMVTWTQIGVQNKPSLLLNIGGYYTPLLNWVEGAVQAGLVRPAHQELLLSADSVDEALDLLASWKLPEMPSLI